MKKHPMTLLPPDDPRNQAAAIEELYSITESLMEHVTFLHMELLNVRKETQSNELRDHGEAQR